MNNQRNVEALADLIAELKSPASRPGSLAQALAARGVLVPSALTPPDNWRLNGCAAVVDGHGAVISREALIAELERIARGEP